MKPILLSLISSIRYNLLQKAVVVLFLFSIRISASSQCTNATLNWDNMDYFHRLTATYSGNNPATGLPFVTTAMVQTQYFALGTNKVTISTTINPSGTGLNAGESIAHTGDAGGVHTGADVHYDPTVANSTITITFATEIQNASFTLNDIDRSNVISVRGTNNSGVYQTINHTLYTGTTLTQAGPNHWKRFTATSTAHANTVNNGAVTITIPGPVKTIIINDSILGTDDPFFLSDITGCTPDPGFPTNYYSTYTTPYTNQPAYFLANPQNLHVYMVDTIGVATYLFSDPGGTPAGTNKMNSLAYDPINHWLYYTMDNATSYPANMVVKKYDFTTGTISTVIASTYTFGLPSFIQGVEYAGAAFYNGCLYLGIEGSDGTSYSTFGESVVWRIEFDGSGTPTGSYCQALGTPGDIGTGVPTHDWGDFILRDGQIITHATGPSTTSNHYIHYNLQTGASTSYNSPVAIVAGQMGQVYNGSVYRINSNVARYNYDGTVGATTAVTVTSCSPAWTGNAGDASDPFRPMQDFGDAPSTYDPVAASIAANQRACNNSTLRIGSAWGDEWSKYTTVDASGDDEEDGVTTVSVMVSDGVAYNHVQDVVVLNNTGANAYLAGWLDYDADGLFEAGEGVVVTVASSATPQTISLGWTGITVAVGTPNSFLRVRLSSSVLTASNATGWFRDGETEDYPVISQAAPLTIKLLDFNATLTRDKTVLLNWKAYVDNEASGFEIESSKDQNNWENIGSLNINTSAFTADYSFIDQQPMTGKSYYRLKMIEKSGSSRYSSIRLIQIDNLITNLKIYPNPVKNDVTVSFNSVVNENATLYVRSLEGKVIMKKTIALNQGDNRILFKTDALSNGLYIIELLTTEKSFINKLTVSH